MFRNIYESFTSNDYGLSFFVFFFLSFIALSIDYNITFFNMAIYLLIRKVEEMFEFEDWRH